MSTSQTTETDRDVTAATPIITVDDYAAEITTRIEAGDRSQTRSDDMLLSAAVLLLEARKKYFPTNRAKFDDFALTKCGLGTSRVNELLSVARGDTTFKKIRDDGRARQAEHREKVRVNSEREVARDKQETVRQQEHQGKVAAYSEAKRTGKPAKPTANPLAPVAATPTPTPDSSDLAEFKYVVDNRLPKLTDDERMEAAIYTIMRALGVTVSEYDLIGLCAATLHKPPSDDSPTPTPTPEPVRKEVEKMVSAFGRRLEAMPDEHRAYFHKEIYSDLATRLATQGEVEEPEPMGAAS